MAYTKNEWHTGDVITEEKLVHMEDGIFDNDNQITQLNTDVTNLTTTVSELGNKSKYEFVDAGDGLEIIVGGDSP